MVEVKYEIYWNDFSRRHESKSFPNMQAFKDWMFGLMNRPYVDSDGYKNMHFLDYALSSQKQIDSSSRIDIRPERGGAAYWIYCVSDNNKVVFSNGKYTNGQCYISDGFKVFLKGCQDLRDGKVQNFVFGEISDYAEPAKSGAAMTVKEENIVNIAMMAGALLFDGRIDPAKQEGHLGLSADIVLLAEEFEAKFAGYDWNEGRLDYFEEIDNFAEKRLMEKYGLQKQHDLEGLLVDAVVRLAGQQNDSPAKEVEQEL